MQLPYLSTKPRAYKTLKLLSKVKPCIKSFVYRPTCFCRCHNKTIEKVQSKVMNDILNIMTEINMHVLLIMLMLQRNTRPCFLIMCCNRSSYRHVFLFISIFNCPCIKTGKLLSNRAFLSGVWNNQSLCFLLFRNNITFAPWHTCMLSMIKYVLFWNQFWTLCKCKWNHVMQTWMGLAWTGKKLCRLTLYHRKRGSMVALSYLITNIYQVH